jgi:serine/threonine protein phosphatase PrpC
VSKIVNNSLPSLILSQKNAIEEIDTTKNGVDNKQNQFSKNFLNMKEAILGAFKVMDEEVKLQENLDCSCSGTTAVVVIRQGEGLVIANLGDSRAILGTIHDAKLKAIQLTTDLKPGLPCKTLLLN